MEEISIRHLVWMYPAGSWDGPWICLGSDEVPAVRGAETHWRQTLVVRLPGQRAIVFGLWRRKFKD